MGNGSLVKNVVYRAGILFFVKIIGIGAKIPLFRLLGPEGTGLYQIAYALYGLILTVVLGGLPSSLALATAQDQARGRELFRKLSPYILLAGALAAILCLIYADWIAAEMGNMELDTAIRCLAPAMFLVPLLGLYRGYLQGSDRQLPIAFSELIEQIVRVTVMAVSVYLLLPYGINDMVGGAALGAFGGAVGAVLFFLLFSKSMEPIWTKPPRLQVLSYSLEMRAFLYSSLTLAATRFIVPLSEFLDAYLIPQRLQVAGLTESQAVSVYGELAGMGALVVYMPTLITNVLGYTISPRLTADWVSGSRARFLRRAQQALRAGFLWGAGVGGFLYIFADSLSQLFFSSSSASHAIRCMSIVPIASGVREISMVILWASGKKREPLFGLLIGIALSVICNYWLIIVPGFEYYGAVVGILMIEIVTSLWNLLELHRKIQFHFKWVQLIRSISVILLCMLLIYLTGRIFWGYVSGKDMIMDLIQMGFVIIGMLYCYSLELRKK